ncbi:MAG TPA: diguanylate cyclase [Syntrophales bacterium]|nr:diguanylate cyclase [Syntrophales bacterium]
MRQDLKVLLVEDNEDDALLMIREMEKGGYVPAVERVDNMAALQTALKTKSWDIILCDYRLPGFSAPDVLRYHHDLGLETPFILVSGCIGEETAVAIMKSGVHDYVGKDNLSRLGIAIGRELKEKDKRIKLRKAEEELRERDRRWEKLTSLVPGVIYQFTRKPDGTYCVPFTTDAIKDIFGCSPRDVCDDFSPIARVIYPADLEMLIDSIEKSARDLTVWKCEYRVQIPGGPIRWMMGNSLPERLADGTVTWYGFNMDITERKATEERLLESELKYRTLVETTNDFVFMVSRGGYFTYVNPNFEKATGYPLAELAGLPFTLVIAPEERAAVIERYKMGVRGAPSMPYETVLLHKDGRRVDVEFLASNLYDGQGKVTGRFGVGRDITKRKEMETMLRESEQKYRELSIIDDLTRLYNVRYFYEQLRIEISRAERYGSPLTLMLLDLDNFKNFNDTYGHLNGNEVLSRLGQVVKRSLRQTDSAYRYGGEEFTIILPMTSGTEGAVTAERIRREFQKEIFTPDPGREVHLTLSMGVAQYSSGEDMMTFVNRADRLMYEAKRLGKNRACLQTPLQKEIKG